MVTLHARSVSFDYPGVPRAVDQVELELAGNELVCVLGPNGSGKSTLLRLLAGTLRPRSGTIELNAAPITSLDARARARAIALVPQSLSAIPAVTVHDFVLGGRYGHLDRWRRSRAHDIEVVRRTLAAADAAELEARLLTAISGGQRQRIMIARALAQEADALLVDEPTNSLDPGHQLSIFELIAQQVREGHAVVVVTHDLNLASQYATRIVLMNEGAIVAQGSANEVLRPEVLGPVYGDSLRFGNWPAPGDEGGRPYVLPWRS